MLKIILAWNFILSANSCTATERITQAYHFQDKAQCERVRQSHPQHAVTARCQPVYVMLLGDEQWHAPQGMQRL